MEEQQCEEDVEQDISGNLIITISVFRQVLYWIITQRVRIDYEMSLSFNIANNVWGWTELDWHEDKCKQILLFTNWAKI